MSGSERRTFPRLMRSLRFRLALTGFLTAYAPTLVLLAIGASISGNVNAEVVDTTLNGEVVGNEIIETSSGLPLSVIVVITIGFAPFAALFAWWWSGRAVRPIAEAVALQERLIEETSHELRTPLAVLTNNAQVLLQHPEPTLDVYRQGLERSETIAKRISETVDTLLVDARGRARTIDRVPADLTAIAGSVIEALDGLATENRVHLTLADGPAVQARVDPASVDRAVSNLITNAIQHAPQGTAVTIEVQKAASRLDADGLAEILVTDLGPGIPAADQSKIFDRYWRADDREHATATAEGSNGSGIGLAIVRQVATAHGGTVSVVSPVEGERGTRFRFTVRTG